MSGREELVRDVQEFAAKLSEEYDCPEVTVGKDRQKGVWGEGMTAILERKVGGDCATKIIFTGGDTKESKYGPKAERKVLFRFRFSWPCVSVHLGYGETFAEIQFGDGTDGELRLSEFHAWGDGGLELLTHVVDEWNDYIAHPAFNALLRKIKQL